MLFAYKGYTETGADARGTVEAPDAREAARLLQERGVFARSIAAPRPPRPLRAPARAALYRGLGALLAAGLPLDRALEMLLGEGAAPDAAAVLSRVRADVREGAGLAAALERAGSGADAFERAAVASAERAATLPAALERLAGLLESREAARGRVRGALVYPCFVLALGCAVAGVMLGFVVPKTTAMLAENGLPLPAASRWLVAAAKGAVFVFAPLALAALALFAAAKARARRDADAARALDRFLLRLPLLRMGRVAAAERFASVLGALVEGGETVPAAMPLAAAATAHPWIEARLAEAAARVEAGRPLAEALGGVPLVGAELAPWARIGEAGGCLPAMMAAAAARLRGRWERWLSLRLALLEPALLAAVGLFVLLLALAVVLPLPQMMKGLG